MSDMRFLTGVTISSVVVLSGHEGLPCDIYLLTETGEAVAISVGGDDNLVIRRVSPESIKFNLDSGRFGIEEILLAEKPPP